MAEFTLVEKSLEYDGQLGLEIRVLSLWRESGGARTAAAGAEEKKCRTNALEADFLTFSFQRAGAQTCK